MRGAESELKAYLVHLPVSLEMPDCGVFAGRLAFKKKVMADGSAADVAGGCVRRYVYTSELHNGGSNRCQVALCVFSLSRPAARNSTAYDVLHDDVATPLA